MVVRVVALRQAGELLPLRQRLSQRPPCLLLLLLQHCKVPSPPPPPPPGGRSTRCGSSAPFRRPCTAWPSPETASHSWRCPGPTAQWRYGTSGERSGKRRENIVSPTDIRFIFSQAPFLERQTVGLSESSVEALCWARGRRLFAATTQGLVLELDVDRTLTAKRQFAVTAGAAWCMAYNKKKNR